MRGIRPPALFELRAHEWRNAVDLHHTPPFLETHPQQLIRSEVGWDAILAKYLQKRRGALFSKQVRLARPVDIPNWSAWGDLHSQGCSVLSRTGLLFPVNHTPVGDPGLAPG